MDNRLTWEQIGELFGGKTIPMDVAKLLHEDKHGLTPEQLWDKLKGIAATREHFANYSDWDYLTSLAESIAKNKAGEFNKYDTGRLLEIARRLNPNHFVVPKKEGMRC